MYLFLDHQGAEGAGFAGTVFIVLTRFSRDILWDIELYAAAVAPTDSCDANSVGFVALGNLE